MTRTVWRAKIDSKSFYIRNYRRLCGLAVISLLLSLILSFAISYRYFHQAKPHYYASNGITALIPLEPLGSPNNSSTALLAPDPIIPNQTKYIPK